VRPIINAASVTVLPGLCGNGFVLTTRSCGGHNCGGRRACSGFERLSREAAQRNSSSASHNSRPRNRANQQLYDMGPPSGWPFLPMVVFAVCSCSGDARRRQSDSPERRNALVADAVATANPSPCLSRTTSCFEKPPREAGRPRVIGDHDAETVGPDRAVFATHALTEAYFCVSRLGYWTRMWPWI